MTRIDLKQPFFANGFHKLLFCVGAAMVDDKFQELRNAFARGLQRSVRKCHDLSSVKDPRQQHWQDLIAAS
jgi:hypothetical protein